MVSLFCKLYHFVIFICAKYNIDESHGLTHSMNVLQYANNIYESEVIVNPKLQEHEKIIYVSAVLHDLCHKKYMNEKEGIDNIEKFLQYKLKPIEIEKTKEIISTMSYSKVKVNGFPDMKEYQTAYHIVREADLLAAYDFDRCMVYNMLKNDGDIQESFDSAKELFYKRMFQHNNDKLFVTEYSKKLSNELHNNALERLNGWNRILNVRSMK